MVDPIERNYERQVADSLTDRTASAEQWVNESMRLLDLYVRGFRPIDVARELVDKYQVHHPDVFDSNPAHTDEQLLASAEAEMPPRPKRYSTETGVLQNQVPGRCNTWSETSEDADGDEIDAQEFIIYADEIESQLLEARKEIARITVLWTDANRWWNEEMARRVKAETVLAQQAHHYAEKAIGDIIQAFKSESIEATVVRGSLSGTIAATLRMLGWPCSSERGYMTADEFRHAVTHYNELRLALAQRDEEIARLRSIYGEIIGPEVDPTTYESELTKLKAKLAELGSYLSKTLNERNDYFARMQKAESELHAREERIVVLEADIVRANAERDELLYHTRHASPDDVAWHSPRTVGHLRRQLEALDPNMAIGCAYFVKLSTGERIAKTTGVCMSYERVNNERNRIESGNKEIPRGIIIWAHSTDAEGKEELALQKGESEINQRDIRVKKALNYLLNCELNRVAVDISHIRKLLQEE